MLKRVSEIFPFDFCGENVSHMFGVEYGSVHQKNLPKNFKVSFPRNTKGLMLVLRLERTLSKDQIATHQIYETISRELSQSEIQYTQPQQLYDEIYFNDSLAGYGPEHYQLKHKLACYEASVHQSVRRLGAIREPFCVGYFPLDEESQKILFQYNYQGTYGRRMPISQRA